MEWIHLSFAQCCDGDDQIPLIGNIDKPIITDPSIRDKFIILIILIARSVVDLQDTDK